MLPPRGTILVFTGNGEICGGQCYSNTGFESGSKQRDQSGSREDVRARSAMLSSNKEEPTEHEAMRGDSMEHT